jgi:catechol 2,3-dioxygenase-like lactoylglutathione lyase family enzyme
MKQSLGLISLVVWDYDEALAFFVGTLGFVVVEDSFVLEQSKLWVVVALPSANESRLLLARASTSYQQLASVPLYARVLAKPETPHRACDVRNRPGLTSFYQASKPPTTAVHYGA